MTGLLVDEYIKDLKGSDARKRITAARELGALGAEARKAVPALETMAAAKDREVRDAATRALESIRNEHSPEQRAHGPDRR